jgi:hypothetical protein
MSGPRIFPARASPRAASGRFFAAAGWSANSACYTDTYFDFSCTFAAACPARCISDDRRCACPPTATTGAAQVADHAAVLAEFCGIFERASSRLPSWPGIAVRRTASLHSPMSRLSTSSFATNKKNVDARDKRGHDDSRYSISHAQGHLAAQKRARVLLSSSRALS